MRRILFSGAFDVLHSAHIMALNVAKTYGEFLIVNLMPDDRIKFKKGKDRPIFNLSKRMYNISNMRPVNKVVSYESYEGETREEYEKKIINEIKPDIFIRSAQNNEMKDWCGERKIDIRIVNIEEMGKLHTTNIIK